MFKIDHSGRKVGLDCQFEKSELKPTQDLEFLGYRFNLRKGLVYPNQKKLDKLKILTVSILQGHTTTPRKLMSLIGVMASMEKTVPLGQIHEAVSVVSEDQLAVSPVPGQNCPNFSADKGPSCLVVGSSERTQGFESASEGTQNVHVHRCIREGGGGGGGGGTCISIF